MLQLFHDDILAFFQSIGVNEDVVISPLPSGLRQQNAAVFLLGIDWVFQQEHGYQDVEMRNPTYPDHGISVQQISFCLSPPTDEEVAFVANSDAYLTPFSTLAEAAGYVKPHLREIVELVTSEHVVAAKLHLQSVILSILDAVRPK